MNCFYRGKDSVARYDIKEVTSHSDRLGVAMEFKEKLGLQMV